MTLASPVNPRSPFLPLTAIWVAHGVALLIGSLLVGFMASQVHSDPWLEMMEIMGAWSLVKPMQAAVVAMVDLRLAIALTGLGSVCAGLIAMKPAWARWPLHLCAAAHLVLVPWASWILHRSLGEVAAHPMTMATEILTVLMAEAGCIIAIIAVERIHRRISTAAQAP